MIVVDYAAVVDALTAIDGTDDLRTFLASEGHSRPRYLPARLARVNIASPSVPARAGSLAGYSAVTATNLTPLGAMGMSLIKQTASWAADDVGTPIVWALAVAPSRSREVVRNRTIGSTQTLRSGCRDVDSSRFWAAREHTDYSHARLHASVSG